MLIFKIACQIKTDRNIAVARNKTVMIGITKITTKDKDKGNNKDKDTTTTTTTKNNNYNNVQQFVM